MYNLVKRLRKKKKKKKKERIYVIYIICKSILLSATFWKKKKKKKKKKKYGSFEPEVNFATEKKNFEKKQKISSKIRGIKKGEAMTWTISELIIKRNEKLKTCNKLFKSKPKQ